jgi:hypothetical protein
MLASAEAEDRSTPRGTKPKPEEVVAELRQGEVATAQGAPVADAIRATGARVTGPRGAGTSRAHPAARRGLAMSDAASIPRRLAAEGEPAPPTEPPFGADDPDAFMHPLEAAQLVVRASRGAIGLDEARIELERALAEGLLSIEGRRQGSDRREPVPRGDWAEHELDVLDAATIERRRDGWRAQVWSDLRFWRKEVLALWPQDVLTLDEATVFLALRMTGGPNWVREWLLARLNDGTVERLYTRPITQWQEAPLPLGPTHGLHTAERLPHPKHWRVRPDQLLEAIRDRGEPAPGRTRVPAAGSPAWIAHDLARGVVARATGYDPKAAAAWLAARSVWADPEKDPPPALRARFAPRALAERERRSDREAYQIMYPSLVLDDLPDGQGGIGSRPSCCVWHPPRTALASGKCPDSGLTLAQVEWHGEELRAALGREFPVGAGEVAPPAEDAKAAKRGRKPGWEGEPIVAEAAILYARAGGSMVWKHLVEAIQDLAQRQPGNARPGSSTAEERAALITAAWKRVAGRPGK